MAPTLQTKITNLITHRWTPKGENIDENSNKMDLYNYLNYKLKGANIKYDPAKKYYNISTGEIAIGLKKDLLSETDIENLVVRIKNTIIKRDMAMVLVGEINPNLMPRLRKEIKKLKLKNVPDKSKLTIINKGHSAGKNEVTKVELYLGGGYTGG